MRRVLSESGQSTVEAAFLIPILLGGMLLLLQPGILLYDRMVMNGAAAQACRLLVTLPEGDPNGQCKEFALRRLSAIPQQDCFHVHSSGCTWSVECEGGEGSGEVTVVIETKVQPLPLIGFALDSLGAADANRLITISVSQSMKTQPDWALDATKGSSPSEWIGAWLDEQD